MNLLKNINLPNWYFFSKVMHKRTDQTQLKLQFYISFLPTSHFHSIKEKVMVVSSLFRGFFFRLFFFASLYTHNAELTRDS